MARRKSLIDLRYSLENYFSSRKVIHSLKAVHEQKICIAQTKLDKNFTVPLLDHNAACVNLLQDKNIEKTNTPLRPGKWPEIPPAIT